MANSLVAVTTSLTDSIPAMCPSALGRARFDGLGKNSFGAR